MSEYGFQSAQTVSSITGGLQSILQSVYENTSNGIIIVDHRITIVAVNPGFTKITGYSPSEVIGKNPSLLNSGRQNKEFYEAMWGELLAYGYWEGEIWNRRKDGSIYPEWLNIASVRDSVSNVQYYVGTFSDISAIKTSEDKLIQLAFYDPLTGLPNRLLFQDRLLHTLNQARREDNHFAVYFIDLDGFKQINDYYGHLVGDAVLIEMANRLTACVRTSDTVARLAGDEFTIIADVVDGIADIAAIATKLLDTIAAGFHINDQLLSCGVSIGIAVYPESGLTPEELLHSADSTMYEVKKSGKNGFLIHAIPSPRNKYRQSWHPLRAANSS